jgi:hypothetical protein
MKGTYPGPVMLFFLSSLSNRSNLIAAHKFVSCHADSYMSMMRFTLHLL